MKFLIDAQLPRRLVFQFQAAGHEAVHVMDLPRGSRTSGSFINQYSLDQQCILVTKDTDFVNSFLVSKRPSKLLLISTGNIKNTELESLMALNLAHIAENFATFGFIEINRETIIFHV
jgi:predicted nuclease of predicted toxin-antitoxin system